MSRPQDADRNQDATCYIGNIDERASDALVWELMIQAGPVVNVHLPKDRITSSHQGYGFCEFQTEVDAEYACRIMNGIKMFGKPLRVNKASSDRKQIDIGANLFVGNLDGAVDERLLYETFSAFGNVVGVPKVARDEQTAISRNFAFVAFDSFEAADAAIEALNNQYLLNRPLNVSFAMKKDGKGGERHGTPAERLLAAQARKNNALPPPVPRFVPPPPASHPAGGPPPPPPGPPPTGFAIGPHPPGSAPPPPPGVPIAAAAGADTNGHHLQHPPPPPPPGFAHAYGGTVPPPPPPPQAGPPGAQQMYYGPPPGMQQYPGPPPHLMTGANNAPLGPRYG